MLICSQKHLVTVVEKTCARMSCNWLVATLLDFKNKNIEDFKKC